eukprot:gene18029-21521_t
MVKCQTPNDDVLFDAFTNWQANYGHQYTSGDLQSKFAAWKANVLAIAAHNAAITAPDVEFVYPDDTPSNMRALYAAEPIITYPGAEVSQLAVNKYSDMSYEEFSATHTGADSAMAPSIAAAGLSAGAIAGIAIACTVAVGASAGAAVVIKKKMDAKKSASVSVPMAVTPPSTPKSAPSGVDVFRFENPHHSITARAPPVK